MVAPPSTTTAHPVRSHTQGPGDAPPPVALGFTDQRSEIRVDELPLEGELPAWLTGSLLRNGPARWDLADGSVNHWFDGMAMLHRFTVRGGRVSYANRLLRGRAARSVEDRGKLALREFGSDPCKTAFGRVMSLFSPGITDNASVGLRKQGDRWLATTESPMAIEFDPETLDTVGVVRRGPRTKVPTAHEHTDHATGERFGLRVALGPRPAYEVTVGRADDGEDRVLARLPVREPSYQHSFALTGRWVILSEHPFVVDPKQILLSGRPFIENYRWAPERGTRFTAVDRVTGEVAGRWEAPADFCFHHVNAWDEPGGAAVAELVTFEDASIVDALRLDARRAGSPAPGTRLVRLRLAPGTAQAQALPSASASIELPRIDDRVARRPHRYVWGVGHSGGDTGFLDSLVVADHETGTTAAWAPPGEFPGEPVFVARPGGTQEGDGVVLSVVLEPALGTSSLVVLDARSLTELGRARVPQHVPLGFHGGWSGAA